MPIHCSFCPFAHFALPEILFRNLWLPLGTLAVGARLLARTQGCTPKLTRASKPPDCTP